MKIFILITLISTLSGFGQSNTFLHEINLPVPDGARSLSESFAPGDAFNHSPFQVTLSYSLSNGPISSIEAILRRGDVEYKLISFGDAVTGSGFTSGFISDFLDGKTKIWSLIVSDRRHDNNIMFLNSVSMTIPEASSGVMFGMGLFILFIFKGRPCERTMVVQ